MKGDGFGFGFGFGAASFFTAESRSSRREGSVQARTAQVGSAMRRPGVGLASGSSSQVSRPHVLGTLRRRWAGSASAREEGELRAEVQHGSEFRARHVRLLCARLGALQARGLGSSPA